MWLQAAINGSRSRHEHPALPVTPEQIAHDAATVVRAGAEEIHLHTRASDGGESLAATDVAAALRAVRATCPTTPIGISTSASILPDARQRYQAVAAWDVLPDYVSVNVHEEGAFDLIQLLVRKGVGIEAGVWDASGAKLLGASSLAGSCMRVLIEAHEPDVAAARRNAAAIEEQLNLAGIALPRLMHGLDTSAWALVEDALAREYATRVGFEDMLVLPDGRRAETNVELVRAACERKRPRGP